MQRLPLFVLPTVAAASLFVIPNDLSAGGFMGFGVSVGAAGPVGSRFAWGAYPPSYYGYNLDGQSTGYYLSRQHQITRHRV